MREKIQQILLGILLISLFVPPSTLLAKKTPKKDIAQQFLDFMGDNIDNSFDVVSKTTILRLRLTLEVNSQITSSSNMNLTNAAVTAANADINLSDPTLRTVSVTRLNRNTIEFELPTIVAQVFLTTMTTSKIQTVFHFRTAKVTIVTIGALMLKGGKIIFPQSTNIVNKKGGNAPPAFSTRSKLTTTWARMKTQR